MAGVAPLERATAQTPKTTARAAAPATTDGDTGITWDYILYPPNLVNDKLQAALKPDNIWAVGYESPWDFDFTYTVFYDGNAWTRIPSPNAYEGANRLFGVAGWDSSNVWAVGGASKIAPNPISYFPPVETGWRPLTLHWDGNVWHVVACPTKGPPAWLQAVATVSPSEAWAVGVWIDESSQKTEALLTHWVDDRWEQVLSPTSKSSEVAMWGVKGRSPNDVWAVGEIGYPNGKALALHWDGSTWSEIPTPSTPERSWVGGVACAGTQEAWAVGAQFIAGAQHGLILHWDGTSWTNMPCPEVGVRQWLTDVSVADGVPRVCGYYSEPLNTFAIPCQRQVPRLSQVAGPVHGDLILP